ncbi:maleylpyruvate isomerase [Saccharopolyspora lacisalsi]|uniref:Maleylpyruvate isomerase n=1 Tax=Halosaccharopolyspora lacisalsi TaxID=1000566 RepID=A0A839DVM3_9PSEU|nr:maleylpyruvate isomerase family mycothiol-dependent enzyme [Halosaccharopolyspora lacisalsi]MBA8826022.1 maleylpyruvate isomerase [Halosaccharopolyspora lacisalsi]
MPDLDLGSGGWNHDPSPPAEVPEPTALLSAIENATSWLLETVHGLDEKEIRRHSLLPGWTRAHVVSHLARNADGCVNLLTWARTGVEHPMYASKEDRDADIQEGSVRSRWLLYEDLRAACARFAQSARKLPGAAWTAEIVGAPGKPIAAHEILRARLLEVWVHLVDLECGIGFDAIPLSDVELLLDDTIRQLAGRPDVPATTIVTDFSDGRRRTWSIGNPQAEHRQVRGDPDMLLGWLLGRYSNEALSGDIPRVPTWL